MTAKQVSNGLKAWYSHMTNWAFVPLITIILWLGKIQYDGFVSDIKTVKENTDKLLKTESGHKEIHDSFKKDIELQEKRIKYLEYAENSLANRMNNVYFALKLKPEEENFKP